MAFDDVRLPEEVERESMSIPRFQTTVVTLGKGAEQRNVDWAQQRLKFDISYGIQSKADFDDVVQFFYARLGRARGFRFKDWSDFEAANTQIGVGDGVTTAFQLSKRYTSVVTYVRKILCPVTGTVQAFVNGVPTGASVNYATGIITISPAPIAAAVVAATFEFDVPVRFNSDELQLSVATWDAASIGSIELVELPTRD